MGAVALAAAPSDPQVLMDLGMYASAASTRDPAARIVGLAGMGRITEARERLAQDTRLDWAAQGRLAKAVAPVDPAWALEFLGEDALEARAACLLALGRPQEAMNLILGADPTRETLLLTAAANAALAQHGAARRALNALFSIDGLEAPLTEGNDPLSLAAFDGAGSIAAMAGEQPLVSVIVAAKNASDTTEAALRSLCRQTWRNLEIIVVDDASTDDTAARATKIAAADPRVHLMSNAQGPGAYGARNTGLGRATGAYIAFHDADDWAHPRRIERQCMALEQSAGSICSYFRVDDQGSIVNPRVFPLLRKNPILLMLRRDALDRIGVFEDVRLGGDSEYLARFDDRLGRGSVARMSQCLVVARWSASSLMGSPETGLSASGLATRVAYVEDWRRRHAAAAA